MKRKNRIFLSPPSINNDDYVAVQKTLESGWVAPVGPELDFFEQKLGDLFPGKSVLAVSSGTAALHLSMILAGVERGDRVLVSSFTFAACVNVILYQGAVPVFIDSEPDSWNLDPDLLSEYLSETNELPKALIVTHLYGVPAQMDKVLSIAAAYGIQVVEDAAEALGSKMQGKQLGGMSDYGVLSFNGNKIVTTSGGGALICSREEYPMALHLATQANTIRFGYEHDRVGYNYRLSNVLAGLGGSQLERLETLKERKREIFQRYKNALSHRMQFPDWNPGLCNYWLTVAQLREDQHLVDEMIVYLDDLDIESRRLWKPLHLHKAYTGYSFIGKGVCEEIFRTGLCLPSGAGLSVVEQEEVIAAIVDFFKG